MDSNDLLRKVLEKKSQEILSSQEANDKSLGSSQTVSLAVQQNAPLVGAGNASLEATQALQYDNEKSFLATKREGLLFRSKVKTVDKNLKRAIEVANHQRELVQVAISLKQSEIEHEKLFEQNENDSLQTELERQELETKIAEEKQKQVKIQKDIRELEWEKEKLSPKEMFERVQEEQLLKIYSKAEILKRTMIKKMEVKQEVRKAFPDMGEEEVEDFVHRQFVESGLIPDVD